MVELIKRKLADIRIVIYNLRAEKEDKRTATISLTNPNKLTTSEIKKKVEDCFGDD
jgi:hypothetical protein